MIDALTENRRERIAAKRTGPCALNLGCGRKYIADALNVDSSSEVNPDVVHDLNKTPWPLASNSFQEVLAYDVIEHLNDVVATLEEIHRVCSDRAIVRITVPHFSSSNAFTDVTHRRFFGYSSLAYFTEGHELSFYSKARFRQVASSIIFAPSILNKVVHRVANRYPSAYEANWAWIFPAWFLYFELEVLKHQDCGQ